MGKSPIKEFLKPNWRKIILSVIFIIPFFFLIGFLTFQILSSLFLPNYTPPICGTTPPEIERCEKMHQEALKTQETVYTTSLIIAGALSPLVSYIFSCIVVRTYDKVKKK